MKNCLNSIEKNTFIWLFLVSFVVLGGCFTIDDTNKAKTKDNSKSTNKPANESKSSNNDKPKVIAWPKDWFSYLGQTVILEGTAANAKLGAILQGEEQHTIWIDGLNEWPDGFYSLGKGKRLRVTGTVIKRDDLPVFVQKPDSPVQAGIPVPAGQLEKAKRRYLLKNAKWTVVD